MVKDQIFFCILKARSGWSHAKGGSSCFEDVAIVCTIECHMLFMTVFPTGSNFTNLSIGIKNNEKHALGGGMLRVLLSCSSVLAALQN